MNDFKTHFSTDPRHPPISVVENKNNHNPEILINFNKRTWIIKNRNAIIRIFCDSLHSVIDEMIDDLIENNEQRGKENE